MSRSFVGFSLEEVGRQGWVGEIIRVKAQRTNARGTVSSILHHFIQRYGETSGPAPLYPDIGLVCTVINGFLKAILMLGIAGINLLISIHGSDRTSIVTKMVKTRPALQETQETQVQFLGWEDPLEKGMVTHSIFLPEKSHEERSLVAVQEVTKIQT